MPFRLRVIKSCLRLIEALSVERNCVFRERCDGRNQIFVATPKFQARREYTLYTRFLNSRSILVSSFRPESNTQWLRKTRSATSICRAMKRTPRVHDVSLMNVRGIIGGLIFDYRSVAVGSRVNMPSELFSQRCFKSKQFTLRTPAHKKNIALCAP